jgi:hypothetical protein
MVDPNPARGMPLQLQRYWLVGKGAAKIRWRMPHDFDRCVRQLRKYFPKNPEGLCNILHQKAVGAPPGKGHGEHALVAAQKLMDMQPELGHVWAGAIAPIGRPTGEPTKTRIFEHGALTNRPLPLPLAWREKTGPGHDGSVTVGRILGITYGPDEKGKDWAYAWGDWLSEDIVPQVKQARHLVQMGVAGPSVDPGGRVSATINPETGFEHMTMYTIGGATLVSIPAFAAMRLMDLGDVGEWPDDDEDMVLGAEDGDDCGCDHKYATDLGDTETFTVNTSGWRGLPLAPRNAVFDNDDAVKRIAAWAQVSAQGADLGKLRRAFLWRDPSMPETATTSYRLPVGDIINGRLTLIYHAIYAAAALLSGAHGGLPGVTPQDHAQLRNVISEIYPLMAREFNDPEIRAPWDRSAREGVQLTMSDFAADSKEPYGNVEYADPGYQEDGKKRYPLDSEEHCRAAWSYINMPKNARKYNPDELATIKGKIKAALKKYGVEVSDSGEHSMAMDQTDPPIHPPADWFDNPNLTARTPLQVSQEGHVFGHLAAWGECHRDVTMRECVLAPHSRMDYVPFHLGSTLVADGQLLRTGKITMDTGHAPISWGYSAVVRHYDDTGYEIASVRAGEDEFGIWVSGSLVPEATTKQAAKLRRSPLSGDWRGINGNLELTAALAVNFPAFPVYAMDNEERTALTAAGVVVSTEEFQYSAPPDGIMEAIQGQVIEYLDQTNVDDRHQRILDILEDEEIYARRERAQRFNLMFAAAPEAYPAPAPAPVAPAPAAPVPGAAPPAAVPEDPGGQSATDLAADDPVAWQVAAEADARFSIVAEPGQDLAERAPEPVAQQPAPAAPAPAAPAPQAPVPVR